MANLLVFADDAVRLASVSYGGNGRPDPNDDLSSYGPGKSFIRSDRTMKRSPFSNNWRGLRSGGNGAFFGGVPQIAFSSARMQRGEILPTLVDNSIGLASYPFLSGVLSPVLRFGLPAGLGATAPIAAALSATFVAYGIGRYAGNSVREFKQWGYKLRHIEQGGDYTDTETAYNLRMRSVSEMSSALSYSRRWLGNEALFMR